jgi:cytoplasmic iron level regulating protein YaaA (DUF328/UPF0246 family)
MDHLRVLLPPSEGKAPGGDGPVYDPAVGGFAGLVGARERVRKALRRKDFDAAAQLGVKGKALEAALVANAAIARCPTMPALRRYTGVLYDALDYRGCSPQVQARLDDEVVIVSGLLGIVRGGDPVPDYKAPMGASLPGVGRLGTFWKPYIAKAWRRDLADAVVWDLLPGVHAAAAPVGATAAHWRVRVLRQVGDRLTTVSHENKTVKGALAQLIVTERVCNPAVLADWVGPGGYRVRFGADVPAGTVDLVAG